ncbi:DUF4321 domain-containing protein [candidate division NPL-UPA2 bacterium]|nr:DUF4321 domain-containing protein [candidate division NPL-UPA2 bacterium]
MARRRIRKGGAGKKFGFWLLVLIIGALIGSIVAEIIGLFFQDEASLIHQLFIAGVELGFDPQHINLYILDFTFGLRATVNLLTFMGLIGAIYLGRLL